MSNSQAKLRNELESLTVGDRLIINRHEPDWDGVGRRPWSAHTILAETVTEVIHIGNCKALVVAGYPGTRTWYSIDLDDGVMGGASGGKAMKDTVKYTVENVVKGR